MAASLHSRQKRFVFRLNPINFTLRVSTTVDTPLDENLSLNQADSGELDTAEPRESVDEAAFALLVRAVERPVFLYAMSLLHCADDAEEVLQRTRVVLWQKFHKYQPGTDFTRWAYAVAQLEVRKIWKESNREKLFSGEFLEMLASQGKRSRDMLEARRQALQTCLGKLRPEDKDLILRRYQRGATTQSVAKELNRSPQGARRSLQRLRERLAECVRRTLATEDHP